MKIQHITPSDVDTAFEIINSAKAHLRDQGIDQWQTGYPDLACITADAINKTGYFIKDGIDVLGYLCIDFSGEPAYETLNGSWSGTEKYVVVHRMAFAEHARGRGLSAKVFRLVEELSAEKGVHYFRVDTDADNLKMQHVLKKSGFTFCGTIWFDNSEKIALDKHF